MTFLITIVYPDGPPVERPDRFDDRAAALGYALTLADDLGRTFSSGDRGWAKWVSIHCDGKLDISIQIIPGGLTGRAPQAGLIAL
ncbi:hypothetical protein [uncultured Sphingomonas sp.]|uniref:hypothetical protein n=1 Tax=uncultured Sphingomonas sp. TaxID=158754 RepID=UPI002601D133|nr:hypothetical protein [uncultured Sphingomonas sp.]